MADQLPRGLRSRSPTPPQTVAFPQSHSSPRIVEDPPPPLQELKPPRRVRQGVRIFSALVAISCFTSILLEKLSKRPYSTILSFPFWISTSLLLLSWCVRRRRNDWERQEGVVDTLKQALSLGGKDQETRWKVWATGASLVLSLTLRIWSLRYSNTLEVQALEVHVLAVYILIWPHLSQTPPCQENRTINAVSVAVSFLVGISLLGNSGSKLGTAISLVRIPVEATSLLFLKDGLSQEDEVKLEEWLVGSVVVATLLSLLPFSLLLILPSTSSATSTFSIVAFLFSTILPLATVCLYDVFLVLLSGTLILFDDPITTIAHLIPRNLVSMIASVHYGTSSSWLQLLTVYSGGTAVLMNLLWKKDEQNGGKEEDCEKALEPDPKPPRFPPKFVHLSLIPLLAFAFYSFIFEPALPLSTACSHLPPSLRPRSCPSPRIEALPSETLDLVISYYNEDVANTRQNLDYMRHIPFVVERQSRVILYNKGEADEETLREGLGLASWDKVIKLPNIGREGATYLRHIIRNYNDTLAAISASSIPSNSFTTSSVTIPSTSRLTFADHTFFLQPHLAWTGIAKPRLWTIPSDVGFASFGPLRLAIHGEDEGHGTYPFIKTIQNMFRRELSSPEGSVISWSAQFIASRRRIMANDYSSYRELDDMIEAPADHWLHQLWGPDNSGGPSNPTFGHSVERSWPIIFDCSDPRQIARECFDSDTAGIWHNCLCRDI